MRYEYSKKRKKVDLTKPTMGNPEYTVFTDGSCLPELYNTSIGKGGCAIIIINNREEGWPRSEYSYGYHLTTNNRMELMAVIKALEQLPENARIRIKSDSKYVIKGMRGLIELHENTDLWDIYAQLSWGKRIDPVWVKGHDNDKNNERCDFLAKNAWKSQVLLHDDGYENERKSEVLRAELILPERFYEKNVQEKTEECSIKQNLVNPSCAKAIIHFWKSESPMEDEYSLLKVGDSDHWSTLYYEWFEENCEQEVLRVVEEQFSDLRSQETCLRWYMRGLSLYEAIQKTAYIYEVFTLKRKNNKTFRHKKRW